jgi:HEAT repeat protein
MRILNIVIISLLLPASLCYARKAKPPAEPTDLTKPHGVWDFKSVWRFNLGPTGMVGYFPAGEHKSDQIQVREVLKDSPAFGKIRPGDVILGVNGTPLSEVSGSRIAFLGNLIDEAETEAKGGRITFSIWRDDNYVARLIQSKGTIREFDVADYRDALGAVIKTDADLQAYNAASKTKAVTPEALLATYQSLPIQARTLDVTLNLEVLGSYSPTSPWDCPKIAKIRERGLAHLADAMRKNPEKYVFRSGHLDGARKSWDHLFSMLALLATDNPEYVELVKKLTNMDKSLEPPEGVSLENWVHCDGRTWYSGYRLMYLGEYYLRTGDKGALPKLRSIARFVAKNQSAGGAWGHGQSSPSKLMNWEKGLCSGNYGALNAAGGVCFYGLTLAQKAGINAPDVDDAVALSVGFNSTWVDLGAVPYGFHGATLKEIDSNGKNGHPALSFNVLGDVYKAKHYSLTSAAAIGEGYRIGHGGGTFGNLWPPLAASFLGKEVTVEWMRKIRPYYTMLRRHDGTFSYADRLSMRDFPSQYCLFDPTAMAMLRYCIPFGKLYITGRGATPEMQATDREIMHLKDILGTSDKSWNELPTAELVARLDNFAPRVRENIYTAELIKRHEAGDADVVPALFAALNHSDNRARASALSAIAKLGPELSQKALPHAKKALTDPADVVAIAATGIYRTAYGTNYPKDALEDLLNAAIVKGREKTCDAGNAISALSKCLINDGNNFTKDPYGQGLDPELVRRVLERLLSMEPRHDLSGGMLQNWNRDAVVKTSGAVYYAASTRQRNGKMFAGGGERRFRELLKKYNFEEIGTSTMENPVRRMRQPRLAEKLSPREQNLGRRDYYPENLAANPAAAQTHLPFFRKYAEAYPTATRLALIQTIERAKRPESAHSLRQEGMELFNQELAKRKTKEEKIQFCRSVLDPTRKSWFEQLAAQKALHDLIGPEALPHLIPFIAHEYWPLAESARHMILSMSGPGPEAALAEVAISKNYHAVAAALDLLGQRRDSLGATIDRRMLVTHPDPRVRGSAATAIMGGSKFTAVDEILGSMKTMKLIVHGFMAGEELGRYEEALLLGAEDPTAGTAVCAAIRKAIPGMPDMIRSTLFFVIGRVGGKENLELLKNVAIGKTTYPNIKANVEKKLNEADMEEEEIGADLSKGAGAEDEDKGEAAATNQDPSLLSLDIQNAIDAISWSRDSAATPMMLDILAHYKGTEHADFVTKTSYRRFLNSSEVIGQVPEDVYLEFARRLFGIHRHAETLDWIGALKTQKSFELLFEMMKSSTESENLLVHAANVMDLYIRELSGELSMEQRRSLAVFLAGPRDLVAGVVASPIKQTWGDTVGTKGAVNRQIKGAAHATRQQLEAELKKLEKLINYLNGVEAPSDAKGKKKKGK